MAKLFIDGIYVMSAESNECVCIAVLMQHSGCKVKIQEV